MPIYKNISGKKINVDDISRNNTEMFPLEKETREIKNLIKIIIW